MILYRKAVLVRSRQINLRPIGDLQMGEKGFRKDLWERWKREALEDSTSLILGMGDYSDRFRTSIDIKLRQTLVTDMSAFSEFDYLCMKEMQDLAEELKPFKHRILGLHCGHHHHVMASNVCTCQYLCQLLGVKHLGWLAMTQLIIRRHKNRLHPEGHIVDIFSTHGCGGSSQISGDLAKVERTILPFWDADLFIRGHSTKVFSVPGHPLNRLSRNTRTDIKLMKKSRLIVNTGGFLDGYTEGHVSYVEQSNLPPCALGYSVINFHIPDGGNENVRINANSVTE